MSKFAFHPFHLKKSINIFVFLLLLTLTNLGYSQSKTIITSKELAVKKGVYSLPNNEKSIVTTTPKKNTVEPKRVKKKEARKKETEPIINTKNADDIIIENDETNYFAEQLIHNASENLGTRYRSGGTTEEGFDCSGLMFSTFKKFNITLPRSSHEMAQIGREIDSNNAKKGDLIFFKTFGGSRISHVGMITEINGDEIKFIHSSTSLGVIISSTNESYYKRTFAQINRVLE